MFEELRKALSGEKIEAYLRRIGLFGERLPPSVQCLDRIVRAHLRTVPFDDADVWVFGREPSLATDDLFEKIVMHRRGGYCFELNLLFQKLLEGLGFAVYPVIVHLGRAGSGNALGAPAHCALIVTAEGQQRFADVGFGGPVPDGSVPLNGETAYGYFSYRNGIYTVVGCGDGNGGRIPRFTFKNQPCDPAEVVPLNFYVARREGSGFAAELKMNLRSDNGFSEIGGGMFRRRDGDRYTEKRIETPQEAKELARTYFLVPDLPVREF